MNHDLASLQKALAELVRTGRSSSRDPYIEAVRSSAGLPLLRACIAEWRQLVLRRACPLTSAHLEAAGAFQPAVSRLLERECPAFTRDLALAFLEHVSAEAGPNLAAVAAFEARMIRAHSGS